MKKIVFTITSMFFALSQSAFAKGECQIKDIVLDKFNVLDDGVVTTRILGRINNNCTNPTGVQLKVVFYDKGGNLLKVQDMWPASVSNIEPHSSFPFEVTIEKVQNFAKAEAKVIRVSTW
jgi:hypothetical protein